MNQGTDVRLMEPPKKQKAPTRKMRDAILDMIEAHELSGSNEDTFCINVLKEALIKSLEYDPTQPRNT